MGAGGSSQTVGYRYYMSLHMGLCRGPIDEIVEIRVGDMQAWPTPEGTAPISVFDIITGTTVKKPVTDVPIVGDTVRSIKAANLFGGDKKEGGVEGTLTVMMGRATQVVSSAIKAKLGGLVPDFRGVVTLFFDGLVASLNPYPKSWAFRIRRTVSGWDGPVWHPELATIWLSNNTIKSMNGAHIIYECLTNRDWGRGFPRSKIDDAGFLAVAQTLFNEGMGLCLAWKRQDELGDFIQRVIDHIGGSLYVDRETGLITISLLRNDYVPSALPTFTYDSGLLAVEDDETISRDDLVNEVIINWHDPIKNKDRQSRIHNLASLQSVGALKSTTTDYIGFPTGSLAMRAGQRDLKANSTALKRYKVTLDRAGSKLVPGGVFRISAPDLNIFNVVLRAGKIEDGTITNGQIVISAVIDVFGLPAASFIESQPAEWEPPDRTAVVASTRYLREITYGELVNRLSPADLAIFPATAGGFATMVAKPSALSQSYSIASKPGGEDFAVRGSGTFDPVAMLTNFVGCYDTMIPFTSGSELGLVDIGTAIQIGDEICRLDDITTTDGFSGTVTIARGCSDTIPMTHEPGTVMFFYGTFADSDNREYAQSETVQVKILPSTSTQVLEMDEAPTDTIIISARQARPWPPGDVKVNAVPFAIAELDGATGERVITWAHRDRTIIQDRLREHQFASVGPEPGTTYNLRAYATPGASVPMRSWNAIAGNSVTYSVADQAADGAGSVITFELEAVRGDKASQFKYKFNT